MDLLTAVEHELGHVLGRDHEAGGVMAETLSVGTRESPVPGVRVGPAQPRPAEWFLASGHRRR